ncbi:MAG: hypothetical protein CFE21_18255 [Bacteroidetes bacterium B1(2017)]|nr:MAG: hypothetical protein CFE21_18255 [Bacteroidetes bacterium B1(2017)]
MFLANLPNKAMAQLKPGGQTGVYLWYDAASNATATTWKSKGSKTLTLTKGGGVVNKMLGNASSNFNPYYDFVEGYMNDLSGDGANASLTRNIFMTRIAVTPAIGTWNAAWRYEQNNNSCSNYHGLSLGSNNYGGYDGHAQTYALPVGAIFTGQVAPNTVYTINYKAKLIPAGIPYLHFARTEIGGTPGVGQDGGLELYGSQLSTETNLSSDPYLTIGKGVCYGSVTKIFEIVDFQKVLSDTARMKVDTYMAVKFGTMLEHDFISPDGATVWRLGGAYDFNVFGIARNDQEGLHQKQSNSTVTASASGPFVTIGIDNIIEATNLTNSGGIDTDKSYLMIGNNGETGITPIPTSGTGSICAPLPGNPNNFSNRSWKVVETNTIESVKIQSDLGSLGFNPQNPIYMQVSNDSTFTTIVSTVTMTKSSGGTFAANYNFTGTQYFRFIGNPNPPANICMGDKIYKWANNWSDTRWRNGALQNTNTIGDQEFKVKITDPTSSIYAPTVYPWAYPFNYYFSGGQLFLPRYSNPSTGGTTSNKNGKITVTMDMSKPAAGASFTIYDIDSWLGYGADVVKVYGSIGGSQVNPTATGVPYYIYPQVSINNSTQTATGTGAYNVLPNSQVQYEFTSAIDKIVIEYTKPDGYSFNMYQDIRISDVNITCGEYIPPVSQPDGIYITKSVDKDTADVGSPFRYKFKILNTNCAESVIKFTDILPSTVSWIDTTLATNNTYTSVNAYGNTGSLVITGLKVPVGTSFVYASAKGTAVGTYNNQASFTINGNTYTSSRASSTDTVNAPTPIVLVQKLPSPKLTVTKTASKDSTQQNTVVKYTFVVKNPTTIPITTTFTDNLPASVGGAVTYVTGTLNGNSNGTINAYGGTSTLTINNFVIAGGGTETFTVDVNTGTFDVGQYVNNIAHLQTDGNATYSQQDTASTVAKTKIILCSTVVKPTLNATTRANVCPAQTVDLTAAPALVSSTCPSGFAIEWHTGTVASAANLVTTPAAAAAGTYYAFCKSTTLACYSAPSDAFTATVNPLPADPTVVLTSKGGTTTSKLCVGDSTQLSANCGAGQTLKWYLTPSTTSFATGSPVWVKPIADATYKVTCVDVASACESSSTASGTIPVYVQPSVAAPANNVSSAGSTGICVGASTTLTATCATGSTAVWYIGTAVATTGSPVTVSPTTTTTYTAKCKSDGTSCVSASTSANDVVVKVNPVVAVPTGITSSKGTSGLCLGDSTNLSATCAAGSKAIWYIGTAVAGTGSPLSVKPIVNTTYTAKCKSDSSSCESVSTSAQNILVTVLPVVANPTGLSSSAGNTICAGTTTSISATCASGSSVVWYSASALIATGSSLSVTPAANVTYTAKCKSDATSCESAANSANNIAIIVTPIPAAPSSVSSGISTICPSGSTTLSGICTTGTIQWYIGTVSVGSGSPLAVAPLATTTYSATCKSVVGICESAKIATSDVTVIVANPAAPAGIASSAGNTVCTSNTATNLTATCAAGSTVQWYIGTLSVGSGSPLAIQPLATTTYTATCKSGTGTCESPSSTSSQITVIVDPCNVPAPIITSNPPTPVAGQPTAFNATGCTTGVLSWYKNDVLISGATGSTFGPITVVSGDKYTSKCTVNNITSPASNVIAVTPTTSVVTPSPNPVVAGQPVTFNVTGCSNGTISWLKNGVVISGATSSTFGPVTAVEGDSYTSVCTVNNVPSSPSTPVVVPGLTDGLLNIKVLLQGPLSGTTMTTTLNTKNLIPNTDPYGKGASTTSAVLTANSITDWVLVELRSAPGTVTESIAALVKNDGTIVNADGTSPLKFVTTSGNFYVSVRHRNHLGVMTASTVAISTTAQAIDFTNAATATFGTNAQKTVGTVKAMWAGNATGITLAGTDKVIYAGSTNDVSSVRLIALSVGTLGTSSIVAGYRNSDLNLDGNTVYAGSNTDTALIRNTVLSYPFSGTSPGTAGIVNQSF